MILDALLVFDPNPTSLAIAVGTQASTNTIDWGITGGTIPNSANGGGARDMGIGDNPALKINAQVVTTFTSGGAGTLSVAIQGAVDNGSGAPGAWNTWYTSPAYALATLTAGAGLLPIDMPRPPAGLPMPRFVRLLWTVAGATMTAGAVTAEIVLDRQDWVTYPAGLTVNN